MKTFSDNIKKLNEVFRYTENKIRRSEKNNLCMTFDFDSNQFEIANVKTKHKIEIDFHDLDFECVIDTDAQTFYMLDTRSKATIRRAIEQA